MTSITIKNCYGTFEITLPKDDLCLDEMYTELIRPVMLAAGYPDMDEFMKEE